jgi:hypothetical protein
MIPPNKKINPKLPSQDVSPKYVTPGNFFKKPEKVKIKTSKDSASYKEGFYRGVSNGMNSGISMYDLNEFTRAGKTEGNKVYSKNIKKSNDKLTDKIESYNMPTKKTKASIVEKFNELRSF